MKRCLLFALLVALVIVGCGGDKAEPTLTVTPQPTETPLPTYTARPTYTPIPTYTLGPSDTPQPTATDTQVPTETLAPTHTPQPVVIMEASDTPVPISPTPIPPTAVPTCAYAMAFASDVTIPDGTAFDPGATFIKTWALKNSGTCAWESGFALKHVSGERMSAPPQVDVPLAQPGAVVNVSVPMQAPASPGTYVGQWKLCDASQCHTGLVTVQIVVKAPVQAAPAANPCAYIGNRNSKIFHYAGCSSANRMSAKNRVCFATREDAIRAGHRPCQRCNP